MKKFKHILVFSGVLSLVLAIFQIIISFSPSLSLYFGAPEALVKNIYMLIIVSFAIAGILGIFGLYAISGAGYIRALPWLKQGLLLISSIFILRGLLVIPEFLVIMGVIQSSIPIAPRFVVFSIGSLMIGFFFITGTIGGWNSFPSKKNIQKETCLPRNLPSDTLRTKFP
ncbi:MAG: hypothetical protein GY710_01650 [Desulfobacteraceae bacterium]|nr:hypothetical protein [Desulfobacteraceae bacterium]